MNTRREFLVASTAVAMAGSLEGLAYANGADSTPWIATQVYPWTTFYNRAKRPAFEKDLAASIAEVAQSGVNGFEPVGTSPMQIRQIAEECQKQKLSMRSIYIGGVFHVAKLVNQTLETSITIAEEAKKHGVTVVVCNPSPIRWGGPENKSDAELQVQADALGRFGAKLAALGMKLGYHTHDIEMRVGAREFHHMLLATDPAHVGFCLDAHWVFRGAGDSAIALFDVIQLYGKRIVELHIRQSQEGIWTEAFGPGDIDYGRLTKQVKDLGLNPLLVLEQAVEANTVYTMDAVEAHKRSVAYAKQVFKPLA